MSHSWRRLPNSLAWSRLRDWSTCNRRKTSKLMPRRKTSSEANSESEKKSISKSFKSIASWQISRLGLQGNQNIWKQKYVCFNSTLSFQSVSFSRKNDDTFKILHCYQNFNLYVTLRRNRNRRTHLLNKYMRFFYWNNFSQINFRETPVETIRIREWSFSYIKILQVCSVLVKLFISGLTKTKYKF